jgi:hypothetical protein
MPRSSEFSSTSVPKGIIMRALRRYFLAPLILAAALFAIAAPAYHAATASPHRTFSSADPVCPDGTNWEVSTQSCV